MRKFLFLQFEKDVLHKCKNYFLHGDDTVKCLNFAHFWFRTVVRVMLSRVTGNGTYSKQCDVCRVSIHTFKKRENKTSTTGSYFSVNHFPVQIKMLLNLQMHSWGIDQGAFDLDCTFVFFFYRNIFFNSKLLQCIFGLKILTNMDKSHW